MLMIAGNVDTGDESVCKFEFVNQLLAFKEFQNSIYRHGRHGLTKLVLTEVGQFVGCHRLFGFQQAK